MGYMITIAANDNTINNIKHGFNINTNKRKYIKFKYNDDIIEFLNYIDSNNLSYDKLILKQY